MQNERIQRVIALSGELATEVEKSGLVSIGIIQQIDDTNRQIVALAAIKKELKEALKQNTAALSATAQRIDDALAALYAPTFKEVTHETVAPEAEKESGKEVETAAVLAGATEPVAERHECHICGDSYFNRIDLVKHLRVSHNASLQECVKNKSLADQGKPLCATCHPSFCSIMGTIDMATMYECTGYTTESQGFDVAVRKAQLVAEKADRDSKCDRWHDCEHAIACFDPDKAALQGTYCLPAKAPACWNSSCAWSDLAQPDHCDADDQFRQGRAVTECKCFINGIGPTAGQDGAACFNTECPENDPLIPNCCEEWGDVWECPEVVTAGWGAAAEKFEAPEPERDKRIPLPAEFFAEKGPLLKARGNGVAGIPDDGKLTKSFEHDGRLFCIYGSMSSGAEGYTEFYAYQLESFINWIGPMTTVKARSAEPRKSHLVLTGCQVTLGGKPHILGDRIVFVIGKEPAPAKTEVWTDPFTARPGAVSSQVVSAKVNEHGVFLNPESIVIDGGNSHKLTIHIGESGGRWYFGRTVFDGVGVGAASKSAAINGPGYSDRTTAILAVIDTVLSKEWRAAKVTGRKAARAVLDDFVAKIVNSIPVVKEEKVVADLPQKEEPKPYVPDDCDDCGNRGILDDTDDYCNCPHGVRARKADQAELERRKERKAELAIDKDRACCMPPDRDWVEVDGTRILYCRVCNLIHRKTRNGGVDVPFEIGSKFEPAHPLSLRDRMKTAQADATGSSPVDSSFELVHEPWDGSRSNLGVTYGGEKTRSSGAAHTRGTRVQEVSHRLHLP